MKQHFKSKYAVRAKHGVKTENILLDQSKVIQIEQGNDASEQEADDHSGFSMYFFKGNCRFCMAHVAIFDPESKTYFFVGVVPNYIG